MDVKMTGDLFFRSLKKIMRDKSEVRIKVGAQMELLVHLTKAAVKDTAMQFHTLFSIIAFTGHKYKLPGRLLFNIHRFRKKASGNALKSMTEDEANEVYRLGLKILSDSIQLIYSERPSPFILDRLPSDDIYHTPKGSVVHFKKHQRVLIVEKKENEEVLIGIDASQPDKPITIRYNLPDRNENFNESIALLDDVISLPTEINLVDVEIDDQQYYLPKAFVLEPDFLIDITAVADASKEKTGGDMVYLIKKFLPVVPNKHLMLGNIANFFLDEIMGDQSLDFRNLINRVFSLNPVAFSLFDDPTAREIVQRAQKHFVNLKMVVKQSLPKHGIKIEDCFLEPTFYSERYGLQGRLDVLHDNPQIEDDASIIELKSGKPFRANIYGLSHNHYIQTLLYDLLIKSASDDKLRPTNYILYSGNDVDHLRFAPAVRSQQYEALAVRNLLVGTDRRLAESHQYISDPASFNNFFSEGMQKAQGFLLRDVKLLSDRYQQLTTLEQKYFLAMVGMIAREHQLAKVGVEGENRNNGQAALWLNTLAEKEAEFNIVSYLKIGENKTSDSEPVIELLRSKQTNALANFRKGDLTILYPMQQGKSALKSQLFKGTIISIDGTSVWVRLRAKQFNRSIFEKFDFWNIEHDSLDSSFIGLYRSLYTFSTFDLRARQKFLTIKPPAPPIDAKWDDLSQLTTQQNEVIRKILSAQDYFLLWGPPGTGKTSVMLRHLVDYLLNNTEEKILLIAYTNRAVDEICRALDQIADARNLYLRIGSRHSSDPLFYEQLLSTRMQGITTRESLRSLLAQQRIIIGTASSVVGKAELFQLIQFDRVIVDEATQMLEPMMAGLLPRVKKAVLIGDHRQLAAVIVQSKAGRSVSDQMLNSIGVHDLGDSYFERIYRRCQEEGWNWAFAKLSHQGRMHEQIMQFPRDHFYDGNLDILPPIQHNSIQTEPLNLATDSADILTQYLAKERVLFLPIVSRELFRSKTNAAEAELTARIVKNLFLIYAHNDKPLSAEDIGIITPFRAQIAKIREEMIRIEIDPAPFIIDTVERFQGGAKEIIIISLCVNSIQQLSSLISKSSDGIDRKFNVALTRAKQQLITMGDPVILGHDATYQSYIDQYQKSFAENN